MACIFILTGCGNSQQNVSDLKIEDIKIIQKKDTQYYSTQGKTYESDDCILILGFNDYQCIDTLVEYNEELETYTCVIEFKKIIDKKEE